MEFTINIEKKHIYLLSVLIVFVGITTVLAAVTSGVFHPLQQIVDSSGNSVDMDGDGIIDNADNADHAINADKLGNLSASQFCRSDGTGCSNTLTASDCNAGTFVSGFYPDGSIKCMAP